MKLRHLVVAAVVALVAASCSSTKEIPYFQDITKYNTEFDVSASAITIRPKDQLCIVVVTQDDDLTKLYNLPYITQRIGGYTTQTSNGYPQGICGYTVDMNGDIDFPGLGRIKVAGKTREQTAALIKHTLTERELAKESVVIVDFMNLYVTILGEVKNPGRYTIDRDDLTILDMIGRAGDLTISGRRDNVTILREVDGEQKAFKVDLTSAQNVIYSPVYYVHQNDIIYVTPNNKKARESTVNGNNIRSASF